MLLGLHHTVNVRPVMGHAVSTNLVGFKLSVDSPSAHDNRQAKASRNILANAGREYMEIKAGSNPARLIEFSRELSPTLSPTCRGVNAAGTSNQRRMQMELHALKARGSGFESRWPSRKVMRVIAQLGRARKSVSSILSSLLKIEMESHRR